MSEFKIGDHVHIGLATKGGAGMFGKVSKIEGDMVHVTNAHNKTWKGHKNKVMKVVKESQNPAKDSSDYEKYLHYKKTGKIEGVSPAEQGRLAAKFDDMDRDKKSKTFKKLREEIEVSLNEDNIDHQSHLKAQLDFHNNEKSKYPKSHPKWEYHNKRAQNFLDAIDYKRIRDRDAVNS